MHLPDRRLLVEGQQQQSETSSVASDSSSRQGGGVGGGKSGAKGFRWLRQKAMRTGGRGGCIGALVDFTARSGIRVYSQGEFSYTSLWQRVLVCLTTCLRCTPPCTNTHWHVCLKQQTRCSAPSCSVEGPVARPAAPRPPLACRPAPAEAAGAHPDSGVPDGCGLHPGLQRSAAVGEWWWCRCWWQECVCRQQLWCGV